MPSLVQKVLSHNGIETPELIQACLFPSLKNLTHPFKILNMEIAAKRVIKALKAGESIAVYGDFDLDGTSGAALLYSGFKMMGFENVQVYQPNRLSEGYGFHANAVEKFHADGVSLIVTVDVGITAVEACDRAKELGIDVIITDHHQAKEQLPDAFTIVNPNQPDDPCDLGYLAGTGVGYYLLMGCRVEAKNQGVSCEGLDLKQLLDFFTIGTITDMVPLIGDNRILCKHGLKILSQTKRPGLRALLDEQGLVGKSLTSQDIGFRFAPKLNALSRLASEIRPIDLYLETETDRAEDLVEATLKENETRKSLQKSATSKSKKMLKGAAEPMFASWVFSDEFHKGVIGLVATDLCRSYSRSAFVGSVKDGVISGSARAFEGQSVLKAMEACSTHLTQFGGHHAAAGFVLPLENAYDFGEALNAYFAEHPVEDELMGEDPALEVEFSEIHQASMNWLESLEPFGVGFEMPTFEASDVFVSSCRVLKEKHLKLELSQVGSPQRFAALKFNAGAEILGKFSEGVDSLSKIQFTPQWNEFNGYRSIQLLLSSVTF